MENFLGIDKEKYDAKINISSMELNKILSRLSLVLDDNKVGLGTLNQLYMAMELLLLEVKEDNNEFGLALIEEIEAHIHPQAQLRVIKYLEKNIKSQIIVTTHSTVLTSIIEIKNLIICRDNKAYSLSDKYTSLSKGDYEFLERFLDSTKSNLFFAKGVILVEGDAENILIPTISEIIGKSLYNYGISIVNVGNVAFLRYSNIFINKDKNDTIGIPISIITDLDVRPIEYYKDENSKKENDNKNEEHKYIVYRTIKDDNYFINEEEARASVRNILNKGKLSKEDYKENIEVLDNYEKYKEVKKFIKEAKYNFKDIQVFTNNWTMEYDIALSCIQKYLYAAVLISKSIYENENFIEKIDVDKYIKNAESEIENFKTIDKKSEKEVAYEIYKPLLKGNASKAVCAQYLSKILKKEINDNLKNEILNDEYIKYIIDAINHVTNIKSRGVLNG
ncbi:MAG: ATP-dependent nuclease [Clostridium sp.]|nr:AAA family ATPase [Clostridium sp.]